MKVRIGTRGSDLALWQAHYVASHLAPEADVEIIVIQTRGDAIDDVPLTQVEGKSFFTAEIERALLNGDVDLAVHSHKDLETQSVPGLVIAAVPERALVDEWLLIALEAHDPSMAVMPLKSGAKVGTSAPRRQAQLLALRGDLLVATLRGNVPTRVNRLREGRYDAIVLAAAGLSRLEIDTKGLVVIPLPVEHFVPAPAQGALALQVREGEAALIALCEEKLHHELTATAVRAERSMLTRAGGGCHLPLGALLRQAEPSADDLALDGAGSAAAPWKAIVFLGADHPTVGDTDRWAAASASSAQEAVDEAWAAVTAGVPTLAGPLGGLAVTLVGASSGDSLLGQRLEQIGAAVSHEKVLSFESVRVPELPARLARLNAGDVVAVTSRETARRLSGQRMPKGVVVAAVGPGTAHALATEGLTAKIVGRGGSAALAAMIDVPAGGTVLFPCAEVCRPELPEALKARGITVEQLPVYRTVSEAQGETVSDADVVIYMSPSAVASAVSLGRIDSSAHCVRVGLGRSTCESLQDEGLSHERPVGSGPDATLALLYKLFAGREHGAAHPSTKG
ncbi:MAG: hydroxymethylbilane synthase [Pseudohongiellaceae bacterium]|jgi:hydroxymethylbilane synthase